MDRFSGRLTTIYETHETYQIATHCSKNPPIQNKNSRIRGSSLKEIVANA
jgi:hypothetical protein